MRAKKSDDEVRRELIHPMDEVQIENRRGRGPASKPEEALHISKAWIRKFSIVQNQREEKLCNRIRKPFP